MRTSNTLAALMLAMGTLSTALPADANGLVARQQGPQQIGQQGPFGQGQQQGQGPFDPQRQGYNNIHHPPLDVGCPDCDKYSHHAYENSNTKSTHTHCENGCCACKPEKPDCKPPPQNDCDRKFPDNNNNNNNNNQGKPCCCGRHNFGQNNNNFGPNNFGQNRARA